MASRIEAAALRLHALDPERVLARGYALLVDAAGRPITSVRTLAVGDPLTARLADGKAELTTRAVEPTSASR